MKINYGEIIAAAQDYNDAQKSLLSKYHGFYISINVPDAYQAYKSAAQAERALNAVCDVLGIPATVPIMAARIENQFYDRAYQQGRDPGILDCERLIKSLLANQ